MLRLSKCARFLIKFVDELLVENLLLKGGVSEFDRTQFALKSQLVVFEYVLGRLAQFVVLEAVVFFVLSVNAVLLE